MPRHDVYATLDIASVGSANHSRYGELWGLTSLFVKTVETIISNHIIETDVGAHMKTDVTGGNRLLFVYFMECINNSYITSNIEVTLDMGLLGSFNHSCKVWNIWNCISLKREANMANNYIELYVGSHIKNDGHMQSEQSVAHP